MRFPDKILELEIEVENLFNLQKWNAILECACISDLEIIRYKTSGIINKLFLDNIKLAPPFSSTGKLLAFLFQRFNYFKGAPDKGLAVISYGLIDNSEWLETIILELAHLNDIDPAFLEWIENHINFITTPNI